MYYPNIPEEIFFVGYELDQDGEPIVDPNKFSRCVYIKKILSYLNKNSFPIYHIDKTYS